MYQEDRTAFSARSSGRGVGYRRSRKNRYWMRWVWGNKSGRPWGLRSSLPRTGWDGTRREGGSGARRPGSIPREPPDRRDLILAFTRSRGDPSPLFPGLRLPLPLIKHRSLPRPGGQFLVVLDDLLRHLVVRLQDLLLARRERAHSATPVFLPRRLVGLEVESPVVDDAEEILPQGEAVSAEHRPAAYSLQGAQLIDHEIPIGIFFLFCAHDGKPLESPFLFSIGFRDKGGSFPSIIWMRDGRHSHPFLFARGEGR